MLSREDVERIVSSSTGEEVRDYRKSSIGRAHSTFFVETGKSKYVLKASEDDVRFQVEAPVIEMLNSETDVSVPGIVAFDNSREYHEFMWFLAEFVDGENLSFWESESGPSFVHLPEDRKKDVLRSVGKEIGKLHSQTSFESSGFLKCRDGDLVFRQEGDWMDIFREIIVEDQAENLPDRFSDLKPLIEGFVDENLEVLDKTGSACLVHQDLRWPNLKVQEGRISGIFDWERSVAGNHEYDIAKAEESLLQFRTERTKDKYRPYFYEGYRNYIDLEKNWGKRRGFYRALRPVEALWTFEGWTKGMSAEKRDLMAEQKREELKDRIGKYRENSL